MPQQLRQLITEKQSSPKWIKYEVETTILKRNKRERCHVELFLISWVFMAQINMKKFTGEKIEPYILTTHGTVVTEMGHSFVKAAPFSFHLTLGTSFKTGHLFHSASLSKRSKHSTCSYTQVEIKTSPKGMAPFCPSKLHRSNGVTKSHDTNQRNYPLLRQLGVI